MRSLAHTLGANPADGRKEHHVSRRNSAEQWARMPRAVRQSIQLGRRSAQLAGPVTVTYATRCECGAWMRPGVDHDCPGGELPRRRHIVADLETMCAHCAQPIQRGELIYANRRRWFHAGCEA
jgi:hypothetical protein